MFGSLRLRAAQHCGDVARGEQGWHGKALVTASRLVDSAPLRATLKAEGRSPAAVVVSDDLFAAAFHTAAGLTSGFRPVYTRVKEGAQKAWVSVAGYPEPPGI